MLRSCNCYQTSNSMPQWFSCLERDGAQDSGITKPSTNIDPSFFVTVEHYSAIVHHLRTTGVSFDGCKTKYFDDFRRGRMICWEHILGTIRLVCSIVWRPLFSTSRITPSLIIVCIATHREFHKRRPTSHAVSCNFSGSCQAEHYHCRGYLRGRFVFIFVECPRHRGRRRQES